MSEEKTRSQYLAAFFATGYAFATGIALGWTNPIETPAKTGELGFNVSNEEYSWTGSTFPLGASVACILTGFLIEAIGRRLTAIMLIAPYTIGWSLIIFAQKSWMLITGRLILGIASGATCVVIPLYVGEIASDRIRGTLSSFFQLQITIGILAVYLIGAFLKPKIMNIICAVFPFVTALAMIFMPETPTYLVKKGKFERAIKSFNWLRGEKYDPSEEIENLEKANEKLDSKRIFFALLSNKAVIITGALMFFQQYSGINAVIFYSTEIFKNAGSTLEPRFSTIVIGCVQVLATIGAVIFVDRLGRRLLLLISSSVMAVTTLTLGIYFFFYQKDVSSVEGIGWLPLAALCVFIIMFSFGLGPVPWIMVGELFAPNLKGVGAASAGVTNWACAFVVTRWYPFVKDKIGGGPTFWIFSFITVLGFLFVMFFVPETKNKSLSEIQDMLKTNKKF